MKVGVNDGDSESAMSVLEKDICTKIPTMEIVHLDNRAVGGRGVGVTDDDVRLIG